MSSFSDLGIDADVVKSLSARRITVPSPIQEMAIPPALAGQDVCGKAPTGSGKTLAFGLPLARRVGRGRRERPRALVLAPTRELAAQIDKELFQLLKPAKKSVASFYGGVGFHHQLKMLRRGLDVAVACPGRLGDLMNRGNIVLDEVDIVVIDEADRMADMGFLPEVKRILDQVRPNAQVLLFSATLDGDVDVLIKRYQKDPVRCEVQADEDEIDLTSHYWEEPRREDRVRRAAQLVKEHGPTIVFCRTKHGTDRVARQLKNEGVSAVPIHGGRSQGQRDRALAAFANGQADALIATDVAARGIHVDDVACVVHFDVAGDHKDYVHRSGRTGRAGAEGVVVSFVIDKDTAAKARQIRKALDMPNGDDRGSADTNRRPQRSRPDSKRPRSDRPRTERSRSDRPRNDRAPRSDKPRTDKPRTDKPRTEGDSERSGGQHRSGGQQRSSTSGGPRRTNRPGGPKPRGKGKASPKARNGRGQTSGGGGQQPKAAGKSGARGNHRKGTSSPGAQAKASGRRRNRH